MEYQNTILENGIRVIHRHSNAYVAHLGIIINAGSRDELAHEHGLAHFIEHTIFKGTKTRKVFHILSRMENVGGEVNAFTTKEETCIYASFLPEYYQRASELLSDVLFNSTFPEKEIEKEKDVIIDEINSYKDEPQEEIFDEFEELLFKGHSLAHNILGTSKSLKSLTKKNIEAFINLNYNNDNIVICSVGNIKFDKLINLINRYFLINENKTRGVERLPFKSNNTFSVTLDKNISHTHCLFGCLAYSSLDNRRIPLMLLDNLLGGPTMNSRLSLEIREKYGLSYNIGSSYTTLSDIGIFNIYASFDNGNMNKTIELIYSELKKMREKKLGSLQLSRAKKQLTGQIAISFESDLNEMLSIGKSYIVFNKVDTLFAVFEKINAVSASDILEIANDILVPEKFSMLTYKPKE